MPPADPHAARRRTIDPDEVAIRRTMGEPLWDGEPPLPERHAILPAMLNPPAPPSPPPPTLLQLTIAAVRATLDSTGAWARLPEAGRRAVMGRLRWELEEVAKRNGVEVGSFVTVGPGDPPPDQPGP